MDSPFAFHHERGIPLHAAGARRWPQVRDLRATTKRARLAWRTLAGPFRTRRAAFRYARQARDASGVLGPDDPRAVAYAVERVVVRTRTDRPPSVRYYVLTKPVKRKASRESLPPSPENFGFDQNSLPDA